MSVLFTPAAHFEHVQDVPAAVWLVRHMLGKHPAVQIVDTAGNLVEGSVKHVGPNQVTVTFEVPFAGIMTCN